MAQLWQLLTGAASRMLPLGILNQITELLGGRTQCTLC